MWVGGIISGIIYHKNLSTKWHADRAQGKRSIKTELNPLTHMIMVNYARIFQCSSFDKIGPIV